MEFKFETAYDQDAVTIMAKALRMSIRKKHSRRSHIFGWIIVLLSIALILPIGDKEFVLDFKTIITILASAAIIIALLFEDKINGYVARKRMLPGLEKSIVTFYEDYYFSETDIGKSEFKYNNILMIVETNDYFVFIFSPSHAQVYNKKSISGGTFEEFRSFIEEITEKEIQII